MKDSMKVMLVLVAGIFLITGCATTRDIAVTTPIQDLDAPEWVRKGSGAFGGERGRVFYGVASASEIRSHALRRAAADNRARNEVAKEFQMYTASLMKDYTASTSAGEKNVSSEEHRVEQAVKTVTAMTLSGVEVVDHWEHPGSGEFFALARLDLEAFKNNLDRVRELDTKVKEYIRKNADALHDELKAEEEKMGQR